VITKAEIEAKSNEFGIHVSNVERDYVFGWLLAAIYSQSPLGDSIVLKGGNCFRKAYFPNGRFSNDLDFSAARALDRTYLSTELIVSTFLALVLKICRNRFSCHSQSVAELAPSKLSNFGHSVDDSWATTKRRRVGKICQPLPTRGAGAK
jgi:hypothetical protein